MKYLRLFENHNYYTQIGLREFEDTIFDEWMDIKGPDEALSFDEKEIEYLKDVCTLYNGKFSTRHRQSLSDDKFTIGGDDIAQVKIIGEKDTDGDCPILIYKIVDEWYYVEALGNGWYKCDQLEGLKKLIGKILNETS